MASPRTIASIPVLSVMALLLPNQLGFAQETPRLTLAVRQKVQIPDEFSLPVILPVKCDGSGNLYVRWYNSATVTAAPVAKYSPEGKRLATFNLRSVPGFEKAYSSDFAVGLRGEVDFLATQDRDDEYEVHIVGFRDNAHHDWTTKLPSLFVPDQLALFPTGEFLASGKKLGEKQKVSGQPFTAIFGRNGEMVKEVRLPGDIGAAKKDVPAEAGSAPTGEHGDVNEAISLGQAVPAEDGNVYLMRAASEPLVYVISPGGEVLRRMVVRPPSDGLRPETMKVAGGKVAVLFGGRKAGEKGWNSIVAVVDAETGEKFADYRASPELGGALACYSPNGFTFLGSSETGSAVIQFAVPR